MIEFHEWREAPEAEFAVVGDPIHHSWSPKMQTAALRAMGLAYRYVAVRVPLVEFDSALARLASMGYLGVNVTVPLKEAAFAWCRRVDEATRGYGAVNTLRPATREGTNTDARGFLATLEGFGVPPGARVLLLGAGGTARTLAPALHEAKYRVRLYNRTRAKADALAQFAEVVDSPDPAGVQVVVNATSAGLSGSDLGIDWSRAEPDALAYDLLYASEPTDFLQGAIACGLRTADGRDLLAAQGELSLEWWLGTKTPAGVMRSALG